MEVGRAREKASATSDVCVPDSLDASSSNDIQSTCLWFWRQTRGESEERRERRVSESEERRESDERREESQTRGER